MMPISTADVPAVHMLIADIQALESRAHRLRCLRAAHALNEAKNRLGWELAEHLEAMQKLQQSVAH
jgi:hypothetical protein